MVLSKRKMMPHKARFPLARRGEKTCQHHKLHCFIDVANLVDMVELYDTELHILAGFEIVAAPKIKKETVLPTQLNITMRMLM